MVLSQSVTYSSQSQTFILDNISATVHLLYYIFSVQITWNAPTWYIQKLIKHYLEQVEMANKQRITKSTFLE